MCPFQISQNRPASIISAVSPFLAIKRMRLHVGVGDADGKAIADDRGIAGEKPIGSRIGLDADQGGFWIDQPEKAEQGRHRHRHPGSPARRSPATGRERSRSKMRRSSWRAASSSASASSRLRPIPGTARARARIPAGRAWYPRRWSACKLPAPSSMPSRCGQGMARNFAQAFAKSGPVGALREARRPAGSALHIASGSRRSARHHGARETPRSFTAYHMSRRRWARHRAARRPTVSPDRRRDERNTGGRVGEPPRAPPVIGRSRPPSSRWMDCPLVHGRPRSRERSATMWAR